MITEEVMTSYWSHGARRVPVRSAGEPDSNARNRSSWAASGPDRPEPEPEPVRLHEQPARATTDETSSEGADEIRRLTRLVEEKDQRARESAVQARLAMEELERAKERIRKDASKELEQRKRGVIADFLDVLDDLERAMEATSAEPDSAVARGVELVHKGFLARLGKHDVTAIPALDQPFDPTCHEALSTVPVIDAEKDGVVIGVIRRGYRIGDEVLRPAKVAVGKMA